MDATGAGKKSQKVQAAILLHCAGADAIEVYDQTSQIPVLTHGIHSIIYNSGVDIKEQCIFPDTTFHYSF